MEETNIKRKKQILNRETNLKRKIQILNGRNKSKNSSQTESLSFCRLYVMINSPI